ASASFGEVEELAERLRRIVANDPDRAPRFDRHALDLVEEPDALFVLTEGAQDLRLQRGTAKLGLDALRIAAGPRFRGQEGVPVRQPPGPVVLLTQHVLVVEVPPRPCAWDPQAERLFAYLPSAVEVARTTSHREALADQCLRHGDQ